MCMWTSYDGSRSMQEYQKRYGSQRLTCTRPHEPSSWQGASAHRRSRITASQRGAPWQATGSPSSHMLMPTLRRFGPQMRPRPYVDDLTTSIGGHERAVDLVQQSWAIVGDFGRVFRWQAAFDKCARFSTSATIRDALRAAPGPLVSDSFSDLGVMQLTTGRSHPSASLARDIKALAKLSRMQALRISFEWRCRFVAGSGIPNAMHGGGIPSEHSRQTTCAPPGGQ